jgi:nucleotide-binding universal stress UspA family protein
MEDTGSHGPSRGHVVVGVDGSESAAPALDLAVDEARRRGVPLEIVHGRPWTHTVGHGAPEAEDARALVDSAAALARHLAPGLEVCGTPTDEDAAAALVRRSRDAALTVVGTRGHGGFTGLLVGSVSLRVAAHTAGALLVVRGDLPPRHNRIRHDTVLVGVESEADADAVAVAFDLAAGRGARLTALHAWTYHRPPPGGPLIPTSPGREDVARQAATEAEAAQEVVAPLLQKHPQVRTRVRTVRGGASGVLVEASRAADVVVVAAHRHRGPLPLRLGPVTHALLHHAHCPVLLVPHERNGGNGGNGGAPP